MIVIDAPYVYINIYIYTVKNHVIYPNIRVLKRMVCNLHCCCYCCCCDFGHGFGVVLLVVTWRCYIAVLSECAWSNQIDHKKTVRVLKFG